MEEKSRLQTRPVVLLMPPQEVLEDPDFKKTSKIMKKQVVGIRLIMEVTEYHADVYYNSKTGERIHAPFPPGVVDDVNYDGNLKAFLFLLNKHFYRSQHESGTSRLYPGLCLY